MIELTEQLRQAVAQNPDQPVELVNPQTQEAFVLIRADVYRQLKEAMDDGGWSDEEMDLLAVEAGEMLDNFGKKP